MEKNSKIMDVRIIEKDGQIYVQYSTLGNDGQKITHERPMYDEKGERDPEVVTLLELAKKMEETQSQTTEEKVDETAITTSGALTVYDSSVKGFFARNKKAILSGIAGALTATVIIFGAQSCSKNNDGSKNDTAIVEVIDDEQITIQYITMEQYLDGASSLNKYLKEKYNSNFSANDLYSFYYVANFENISTELFEELVKEGYIPDNNAGIISNALKITTIISDQNVRTGVSNVDYNYIFVNEEAAKSAASLQQQFNTMSTASKEDCVKVVENLENYYVVSAENKANNLPVGAEEIIGLTEGISTVIVANGKGVEVSDALNNSITDVSTLLSAVNHNLICLNSEEPKQLTK